MFLFKVLITPRSFEKIKDRFEEIFKEEGIEVMLNPFGRVLTEEEMRELIRDVDGLIVGVDPVTSKVLENANKLKVISKYGVGVDNIDILEAKKRNIVVTNTPGANSNAVAELTVGLIINVLRKINLSDKKTREGRWDRFIGNELSEKILGVIGTGSIGRRVIELLKGFNLRVLCFDKYPDYEWASKEKVFYVTLDELLRSSDVVSIHVPLTEETYHMISEKELNMMKKNAVLINTSRGGIVDEDALYRFLKEGRISGAGLDVFEKEPPQNSPLLQLDNVVVTSHIGAHTEEAVANMAKLAVENLLLALKGREPLSRVC
ncbi:MAG: phosphoglycerate dehydrogenase [Dictyoglomus thermophilum]